MRCLLKLFGGSSVFLEKPLEQRRVAPVRLEIVPIGIFRGLKLRYVSQLHQAVDHLNRLMANANGVRRLLPASLPRTLVPQYAQSKLRVAWWEYIGPPQF